MVSIGRMDLEQDSLEILFCEIQQRTRDNSVLFGVVYRPPGANMDFSLSFRNWLDKISRTRFSSVILTGDFNFPNIDWHTVSPTLSDPHTLGFCSIVKVHFLSQCNFAPTRTVNGTANILDLIFTTSPSLISNTQVIQDGFVSDHHPVLFDIKLQRGRSCKSSPRQVYDFKKANLKDLNELFHWIPWNCAFLENDVNSAAVNVTDLILAAADDCIPKFVVKKKLNPPWITREVLKLVKKKRKLWGRLKSEPSIQLRESFQQFRSETKKLIRSNYRKYLVKLSESLKDNPRRFWSFHSIKTKSRRLPESVFYEGVSTRKPSEQANLFNLHFHSVFSKSF